MAHGQNDEIGAKPGFICFLESRCQNSELLTLTQTHPIAWLSSHRLASGSGLQFCEVEFHHLEHCFGHPLCLRAVRILHQLIEPFG
jgi:hypothetical protein